jgi:type II secretion system protein N
MALRAAVLILSCSIACGDAGPPSPTSGPIDRIVHIGPTAVTLYAVRHRLELDELPIDAPVPLVGAIELDADVAIPLVNFSPAPQHASGRARVRCIDHCQIGDGAPVRIGRLDPVPLPGIALDGLDAEVRIKSGVARLTRWALASSDLELEVSFEVRLARSPAASALEGCLRFRPTAALATRDPKLHTLITLASPVGTDGWSHVRVTGTVGTPRLLAAVCDPMLAPR